jgi:hypothetical protein
MTEQAFIENWWKTRFPTGNSPTLSNAMTFADALALLKAFRGADDVKWMTGPTEKAWWLRKFPEWHSVITAGDAEDLLIGYRKGTEARWPNGKAP